jgi:coenzyme PQQ precursor peptide PqqA
MNTWTTPAYTEISMSAEIGGYQDDFDERAPKPEEAIRRGDDPSSAPNEA